MRKKSFGFLAAALMLPASQSQAGIALTFEGIADDAAVRNFYSGGVDGAGNVGENFGVSFSSN
ncbi:MAG: hypothetical protein JO221_03660, partial [Sphingomonas sp.]|nr:hypothetical protein [Sphingomonas sp.]